MNDYVQDTNQQQLEARNEIAEYVKTLEQQLREVRKNRSVSINEPDGDSNHEYSQQHKAETADLRDDYHFHSQVAEQNQSENVNFEHYLKSSSDFDEEGVLQEVSDNDPFDFTEGLEDENLDSHFRSSTRHLVQPDNIRMARITTIEGFISPHPAPTEANSDDDSKIPKRPPRKTSSTKRRKLPEVVRKLSVDSTLSTDSAVTRSDETASIVSFESQISRDTVDLRRGSRGGSNRRLPPVPSGEEIAIDRADTVKEDPPVEPPSVTSIYKGPNVLNNHWQDSGLGSSIKNSPVSPSTSRRFSLKSLKKRLSRAGKTDSGIDEFLRKLRLLQPNLDRLQHTNIFRCLK